jgi:group I intron endonuclease
VGFFTPVDIFKYQWYITSTSFVTEILVTQVIYKIINLVNDKFYVGSTTNKKVRFRQHRKLLRGNRHHCKHLQAAWNKYGEAKFDFLVIEEVGLAISLQQVEDCYLKEHVGKPYCYNSGYASDAPWRNAPPEATPNFGRVMQEEQKAQISASLKEFYAEDYFNHPRVGKLHTEETKAKISAKKRANPVAYWQGKERSEDTKVKIGAAQRGVAKAPRTFTPEGLARAQENMKRNAKPQVPADFEAVHAKFPAEVQAKYDFSNAIYTGALVRIEGVLCEQHGTFSQYAAQFRKGRGCPACGAEQRAESKRAQMKAAWATQEGRKTFMEPRKHVDPV